MPFGEYLPHSSTRCSGRRPAPVRRTCRADSRRRERRAAVRGAGPAAGRGRDLLRGDLSRRGRARGTAAGWLLNVTNDAWFGAHAGPHQHLAQARLRAIEEGLPLVRAANTGISAVVDAVRPRRAPLPLGDDGVLDCGLSRRRLPHSRLYARLGVWSSSGRSLMLLRLRAADACAEHRCAACPRSAGEAAMAVLRPRHGSRETNGHDQGAQSDRQACRQPGADAPRR